MSCNCVFRCLIQAGRNSAALSDQDLAQLGPDFGHLLWRNLLPRHHRIARARIGNELFETLFLAGLFEECFDLSLRDLALRPVPALSPGSEK